MMSSVGSSPSNSVRVKNQVDRGRFDLVQDDRSNLSDSAFNRIGPMVWSERAGSAQSFQPH